MKYEYGLISIVLLACLMTAGNTGAEDQSKNRSPGSDQNQQDVSRVTENDEKKTSKLSPKQKSRAESDGASNMADASLEESFDAASDKAPGIYYKYDKLGRILRIERIPSP